MKALESKVRKLTTSVTTLKKDVATLTTISNCFGAQGVTLYGNPAAGQGYVYTNDGIITVGLTTAFDATPGGQVPTFYAATLNPACVTSKDAAFKLDQGSAAHRTSRFRAT